MDAANYSYREEHNKRQTGNQNTFGEELLEGFTSWIRHYAMHGTLRNSLLLFLSQ